MERLQLVITEKTAALGEGGRMARVSRRAARGILRDAQGRVALLHMAGNGCDKLPGGGIEDGESPAQAFCREVREETGFACDTPVLLGTVEEHKVRNAFLQRSFVFTAAARGEPGERALTRAEQAAGMELRWLELEEARALTMGSLENCAEYGLKFMLLRELAILNAEKARRAQEKQEDVRE
ncbi:MAG: NUDIX hydrolase [Eubacteriales bacterium]|nr:NUDIX hydrolase [Eubacteriales bacterium]